MIGGEVGLGVGGYWEEMGILMGIGEGGLEGREVGVEV